MTAAMPANQDPFGRWSNPFLALGLVIAWFALVVAFAMLPTVDLAASALFFDETACARTAGADRCAGFPLVSSPSANAVRDVLQHAPVAIGLALSVLLVLDLRDGARWRHAQLRTKAILLATLALGPGVIVNGVLKEFWGRPRPWMTEPFGGTMPFVEAGSMAGACAGNCSFISGEAAGGGWLICLTVLFPPELRRAAFIVLALAGATMAVGRVAFGAHFLSDAVLGFLLVPALFCTVAAIAASMRRGRAPAV